MRGHLDECISFGSIHTQEDEDDDNDQLVRRRRSSQLEGENVAESSRRRQS